MKRVALSTFFENSDFYLSEALSGKVFVYPTDTIYGIWWIVSPSVIEKISACKQRPVSKHYSIIAPNTDRVLDHFDVPASFEEEWNLYAMRYWALTLILPKDLWNTDEEHKAFLSEKKWDEISLLLSPSDHIWVRFVDHPFQDFVTALWQPFITTSVNISWQPSLTDLDELLPQQHEFIDYIIDDWVLDSAGSTIIHYSTWERIR